MIIQRLDDHSVVPGEAVRPRFRGPSGLRQGRGGQGPFDWSVQVSAPVTNDKPLVRAVNVTKSFGQHEVLKGVDMTVDTGEVVCLLGPSGSGKTTFLRLIMFPHMTALENVMEAPVQVKRLKKEQARTEALDLLDRVGLAERAKFYPSQLSGGQQQRVAI